VISKSWQFFSAKKLSKLVKFTLEEKKKFQKTPNYSAVHNNKFCQKKNTAMQRKKVTSPKAYFQFVAFRLQNIHEVQKGTH